MRPPKPQILTTDLPVGRFHREHGTASHRQTKIAVTCLKPAREGFVAAERISPRSCQSGYGTLASFCRKLRTSLLPCGGRSEEHTSELQSLMRISYAVFCLIKKTHLCKHKTT